jgi:kelch-like protein 24/35
MSSPNNQSSEESLYGNVQSLGGTHIALQNSIKDFVDSGQKALNTLKNNRAQCVEEFVESKNLEPEKGDLIEILREGLVHFSHWGVYVGDRYIMHLVIAKGGKAEIKRNILEEVAKKSKCRVNNLELAAKKINLEAKPYDTIERNALNYFNDENNKKNKYNVKKYNCEHYATYCRYGKSFSEQSSAIEHNCVICKGSELIVGAITASSSN